MNPKLKILIVNWKWYRQAGDWTYIDNLKRLYESHGHEVIPFSMKSPKNMETNGYDKYFVDHIDYEELNKKKNISNVIRALSRSIFSRQAKDNLEQLLNDNKIHIAHLHNIHHYITPGILPLLKKFKIPVIWTLHDYTILCPENSFISDDKVCENCKGGKFYHCAIQKCKKKSFLASSLAAMENYVHRYLHVFKHVDYFLCPSMFLYNKFRDFNFYPEKLILTNLCCEFEHIPAKRESENFVLFVGRLEKIKGVVTLLKAMEGLHLQLRIAGDGPQMAEINGLIKHNQWTNVVLLGQLSKEDVYKQLRKAKMLVCPSEWYENFPYSIIEAMSLKTPIIASEIGGIPELVRHEQTGLLFEPFNFVALRESILRLFNDNELREKLAENAYTETLACVNYQKHYHILRDIYSKMGLIL